MRGLGNHSGAVIMLDPRTGEVLALASTPIYDASAIANPATAEEGFAAVRDNPAQPLLPSATQRRYVPGSVFKIVTSVAALGSGAIEPTTTFEGQAEAERNGLVVEGFRIREHAGVPARTFDLVDATEVSSNIWFALAGLRTGGANLREWAAKLGFDSPLPFDLPTAISQVTNASGNDPGGFRDDVELASRLVSEAAERIEARIDGPMWCVLQDNPAHAEARRLAAEDARSKAEEYSAVLGGRVGAIASVVEPGASPPGPQPRAYVLHQEISGMPLDGGEHEVVAEIDVTFQLEQG